MKTYIVVCHGCGHIREHQAVFLSSPRSWSHDLPDGSRLVIPCWGCEDCVKVKGKIAAAYQEPSTEALTTFFNEAPEWRGRILALGRR